MSPLRSPKEKAIILIEQGRPFREGISENKTLYYGLLGASAVALSGAMDFMPELNRWLQIVEMKDSVGVLNTFRKCSLLKCLQFKLRLTLTMIIDFAGCWLIEVTCKHFFADLDPKEMITRGRERREQRRMLQEFGQKASKS